MTHTPDPWTVAADIIDPRPDPWLHDPAGWITHRTGEHLWSKQTEIVNAVRDHRKVAVKACHGPGKALALDTPLPTPTGWTDMGSVQPGDQLIDEQGRPCTVTAVSPIETRDCARLTFDDQTSIVASTDHLWQVLDHATRHRLRARARYHGPAVTDWRDHWPATTTHTTGGLAFTTNTRLGQRNWSIPTTRPIAGAGTVPHPYTLGVWLGDGTRTAAAVTLRTEDQAEITTRIAGEGITTRLRPSSRRAGSASFGLLGYAADLRRLGVLGSKHVPPVVLRSEISTRLAVLRGLMDTDGYVAGDSNEVGIELMNRRLASGVAELVRTFGWKAYTATKRAKLNGVDVGAVYRLTFRPDLPVFTTRRQLAKLPGPVSQRSRHTHRMLVSIDPAPSQPTKCVVVDSASRLYLAGEAMLPTHNSYVAARVVAWWIDVHPPAEAFAVTSAPTAHQVSAILWREIRRAHRRGQLPGRVIGGNGNEQWKLGEDLVAMGRKPADHDPDGFQGIHDRYVLVVLDEACGITKSLWTATDTLVTNEDSRILAIGNPDDPLAEFAEVCAGAPEDGSSGMSKLGWWVITISLFDTPNFTDEQVPDAIRPYLPSTVWLEERRQRWGEKSPLWSSKVLGRFPKDASDGTVPWSWLQKCRGEEASVRVGPLRVPVELGVDVGGSDTGDETVIRARAGMRALDDVWRLQTGDSEEIVDQVLDAVRVTHATAVKVDAIGVGFGVYGSLRRRAQTDVAWPVDVHSVVVSEAASQPDRFVNLRAEMWWEIGREYSRTGVWDLDAVDDETLIELAAPKYREVNRRVQIEAKDEVRRRIGRSTDNADALLLAFHQPAVVPRVAESVYTDRRSAGRR